MRAWRAPCPTLPGRPWASAQQPLRCPAGGSRSTRGRWAFLSVQMVSPVPTFFKPTAAQISPARISLMSSRLLACIFKRRPMRSVLPVRGFSTESPVFKAPEYTRMKINWPTNGSVMILKPRPANGAESSAAARQLLFHIVGVRTFDSGNIQRARQILDDCVEQSLHTLVLE